MRKRSGVLLLLTALALTTGALASTVDLWLYRLPDPAAADRDGLFRWLVLRDLASESAETRAALIGRFEQELEQGLEISSASSGLEQAHRDQLQRNLNVLVADWFRNHARTYAAASGAERAVMLDQQSGQIERWGIIEVMFPPKPGASQSDLERLMAFEHWAQGWIDPLAADERQRVRPYLTALESQMVARRLRSLW